MSDDTRTPTNTATHDPFTHLAGMMGGGGVSGYIEEQERAGQVEIVNATTLPVRLVGSGEEAYIALGFTFGDAVDDLFREATLPEGWSREGSDHAMWSYLVDATGKRRVAIFYKAAFYDRAAHMSIEQVG
jgi:hypothetical protein